MKKFAKFIVKNKFLFLIVSLLLIIPSILGYYKTKTNYDILVYLPSDIETLKGQKIIAEDFNIGAFSLSIVDNIDNNELLELEKKIRKIDSVKDVVSVNDLTGLSIPIGLIPNNILEHVANNDSRIVLITFSSGTSDAKTIKAIEKIGNLSRKIHVGGMSSLIHDTRDLVDSQTMMFVIISVICCLVILFMSLDSYAIPFILLGNIGFSILLNLGSNIFLGEISYITKAIAAVLQLGVTTDFSIFLYHKYEYAKKKYSSKEEAMEDAIKETMVSVIGSSLTTIAGFLALCSMQLGLGKDIGIVMAKGVLFGVISVLTLYPSLLLYLDKYIAKTKHKPIIPKFKFVKPFILKYYKVIFTLFIILLIPAFLSQKKTEVYYNLDSSIPDNYSYAIATKKLNDSYNMVSQELLILDAKTDDVKINNMIDEINNIDGINSVLSSSLLSKHGISESIIPEKIQKIYKTDKYKLVLINSNYENASDEFNNQISKINKIVKKYNKNIIIAGEGPLMNDMVKISATDFKNVNYVSIGVIFLIMFFVLKSFSLPIILVTCIEFAIFINMGLPYWTNSSIPFVSSIVIGTIQLGATIDYAILLTTKYIEERKKKKEKLESMGEAIDSSLSSIFVSAMCFFAATIGVYVISKIDMIGSLCLLMSRGAIISMLVVTFVLPSSLLVFDKIITKSTLGFKKGIKGNEK